MKKEKVEYYTLRPSLKQYFGRRVNKALTFDESTDDKTVHQTLKDLVLTTEIQEIKETKILLNGKEETIKTIEKGTVIQELPSGLILIWDEKQGYVIPPYEMSTLESIKTELNDMQEAYRED